MPSTLVQCAGPLEQRMTVGTDRVKFYTQKNLAGSYNKEYKVGDSIAFLPNDPDNDKYMSCEIGTECWVNAYEHNDAFNPEPGAHQELKSGVHNDLTSLKGLSMFQVLENKFGYAIDIRLVDFKDTKGGYKLSLIPYQVNPAVCLSGDAFIQCPIPKLTPPDSEIVCQVVVAETAWPGATVANGSVYFRYNPSTGLLSFRKTEGFPTNMSLTQAGMTQFTFKLEKLL
ncbi:hypothetical protein SAMD00019534_029340, partial [Acytostelium subglobosum LB1]|uniref:hypothetical protein n=1 Tax=Acytostelium subglobosum LB1 TaxID=1410327 RepID=UPI000644D272